MHIIAYLNIYVSAYLIFFSVLIHSTVDELFSFLKTLFACQIQLLLSAVFYKKLNLIKLFCYFNFILQEVISDSQSPDDDNDELSNKHGDSSFLNTSDSYSSGEHIHKKMKISNSDFSDSD